VEFIAALESWAAGANHKFNMGFQGREWIKKSRE